MGSVQWLHGVRACVFSQPFSHGGKMAASVPAFTFASKPPGGRKGWHRRLCPLPQESKSFHLLGEKPKACRTECHHWLSPALTIAGKWAAGSQTKLRFSQPGRGNRRQEVMDAALLG